MQSVESVISNFRLRTAGITPMAIAFAALVVSRILYSNRLAYAIMGLFSLWVIFRSLRRLRLDLSALVGILLGVACSCMTLMSSEVPGDNLNSALKIVCWTLLFYSGCLMTSKDDEDCMKRSLLQIRDLIFVTVLVGFVMQYVLHVKFATDITSGVTSYANAAPFSTIAVYNWQDLRMRSVFCHPIIFADLLLFAIVVTAFLDKRPWRKTGFIGVFLIALFLTQTRGAWLTLILFIALQAVLSLSRKNTRWEIVALLPVPILLGCFIVWSSGLWDQITERLLELNTDVSYTQRSGAIEYIITLFASDPSCWLFGHGSRAADAAMLGTMIEIADFDTVDNQWVAALYDFGIVPTALLAVACLVLLRRFANSPNTVAKTVAWAGVFLSVCDMFFYNLFTWNVPSFIFFVSLGFLCGSSLGRQSRKGATSKKIAPWASSPSTGY